jgi:hypothetical protein
MKQKRLLDQVGLRLSRQVLRLLRERGIFCPIGGQPRTRYKGSDCKQPRHRPQVMRPDLPAMTKSIFHLDPEMVIAELDSLARAILVLRDVLRASVRDCSIQLNVASESVLAVQCRITTWRTTVRKKQRPVLRRPA